MSARDVNDRTCVRLEANEARLQELKRQAYANDHLVALAAFIAVAGNETLLRMLYTLWQASELCVCDLTDIFEITQPAVSRHLKILREKALVEARRDAQTIYYRVCTDNPFARMLLRLFEEQEADRVILNLNLSEIQP